jgi:hypothetical protein
MVHGQKNGRHAVIRWDAAFPTLRDMRRREVHASPISWATAHLAALFVKHFPRGSAGVHPPESLAAATRQAILSRARAYGIRIGMKLTLGKPVDDED